MKVFISWSGDKSKVIAAALHRLLPDMLQHVGTWMSEHDIDAGARWNVTLNAELETSNFGILCLTPENLGSSWLLFEAGSIAKSVSHSRVVPYLFDLKSTDISYPLAQFQGVEATKEGTLRLIRAMNAARNDPMTDERLRRVFDRWWPDLEGKLRAVPNSVVPIPARRDDHAILEEILQLVRAVAPPARPQPLLTPTAWVWKLVHEVSQSDMKAMSLKEVGVYLAAVRNLYQETVALGEQMLLDEKEQQAIAELARRGETERSARESPEK